MNGQTFDRNPPKINKQDYVGLYHHLCKKLNQKMYARILYYNPVWENHQEGKSVKKKDLL